MEKLITTWNFDIINQKLAILIHSSYIIVYIQQLCNYQLSLINILISNISKCSKKCVHVQLGFEISQIKGLITTQNINSNNLWSIYKNKPNIHSNIHMMLLESHYLYSNNYKGKSIHPKCLKSIHYIFNHRKTNSSVNLNKYNKLGI